ncbi:MAG: hypothetical protein IJ874_06740 [Ruminococcus sp.]|nr:hypothetical protein [Ruminococcus sp.]
MDKSGNQTMQIACDYYLSLASVANITREAVMRFSSDHVKAQLTKYKNAFYTSAMCACVDPCTLEITGLDPGDRSVQQMLSSCTSTKKGGASKNLKSSLREEYRKDMLMLSMGKSPDSDRFFGCFSPTEYYRRLFERLFWNDPAVSGTECHHAITFMAHEVKEVLSNDIVLNSEELSWVRNTLMYYSVYDTFFFLTCAIYVAVVYADNRFLVVTRDEGSIKKEILKRSEAMKNDPLFKGNIIPAEDTGAELSDKYEEHFGEEEDIIPPSSQEENEALPGITFNDDDDIADDEDTPPGGEDDSYI